MFANIQKQNPKQPSGILFFENIKKFEVKCKSSLPRALSIGDSLTALLSTLIGGFN